MNTIGVIQNVTTLVSAVVVASVRIDGVFYATACIMFSSLFCVAVCATVCPNDLMKLDRVTTKITSRKWNKFAYWRLL